jgi:hypothetical protein
MHMRNEPHKLDVARILPLHEARQVLLNNVRTLREIVHYEVMCCLTKQLAMLQETVLLTRE